MKATLIIKRSYIDDSDATIITDAKLCNSIDESKAAVLAEQNEEWETQCKSFDELAQTLLESGIDAGSKESGDDTEFDFFWYDNGKGEEFLIMDVDENYSKV